MSAVIKQWRGKHLGIPWVSLWLLLLGMHVAVCSVLAGKIYIQEVWIVYGIFALVILLLAILPRRLMIAALFAAGLSVVYWCWRSAERLLSDLYILVYYINARSKDYIRQSLIAEKWSQKGTLTVNYLLILLCILLGMFIAFSLFRYFNRFYGVLPIFLLYCGGLMLGRAPEIEATVLLLIGMALAFMWMAEQQGSMRFAGHADISIGDLIKRYALTAVIIGIGLSGAGYCTEHFQGEVFENVKEIQRKQLAMELAFQKKSGDLLQHMRGALGVDGGGRLSNSSPYYTDSVMMKVTVKQRPGQNVYLRGFVGDIYHKGRWEASDQLGDLSGKGKFGKKNAWEGRYLDYYNLYGDVTEGDMEIRYKKRMTYRYQPYQMSQGEEELSEQELETCSGERDDELELYKDLAWQMKSEGIGVKPMVYYNIDVQDSLRSDEGLSWDGADSIDSIDSIGSYSDELSNTVFGVQWMLRKNAEYSLSPDPLPYDRDYAEYFLFVSGKGYCEHFATAGTLLLRYLGVRSRYATGYCITADQFSENKDGTYTAEVLDSDAHAWCEVWMEGIWMPQEMTPGNEEENANGETEMASGGTGIELLRNANEMEEAESTETPEMVSGAEEEPKKSEEETAEATATALPEEIAGNPFENSSKGGNGAAKGGMVSGYRSLPLALQVLLAIVALGILTTGIVWTVLCRRKRNRELRLSQMRSRSPKRYVGMRIMLFLERMKRAGLPVHIEMAEREWLQVLQENYKEQFSREEEDGLLELVRRAAFSEEQVFENELYWLDQLCRRLETAASDSAS